MLKEKTVQVCLTLSMVICLAAMNWNTFQEYRNGKTTFDESYGLKEDSEALPTLTICANPPFDMDYLEDYVNPYYFLFTSFASGAENLQFPNVSLEYLWNTSTIKPDLISIKGVDTPPQMYFRDQLMSGVNQEAFYYTLNSFFYGRCTSFVFWRKRFADDPLSLNFIFYGKQPSELILFLHETPGARFCLIPGDYPSKGMKEEKLLLGQMKMLGISKSIKKHKIQQRNGKCIQYSLGDSQAKCYIEKVLVPKLQQNNTQCTRICNVPQLQDILELSNLTDLSPCTDQAEYECMITLLRTHPVPRDEKCKPECNTISFETRSKSFPLPKKNQAMLSLYFDSNHMTTFDEYLIFDDLGVLVAVGGSLGLFLGFSFLQFAIWILKLGLQWFSKKN